MPLLGACWALLNPDLVVDVAVLHAMILFAMVITLNVSVNSNSNSLFVVLVSNNFMGT